VSRPIGFLIVEVSCVESVMICTSF